MGVILAKFRKEKSTQKVLEALQKEIDTLEAFTVNTQEQKRRIVGNLLAVSIGIYVVALVIFYLKDFPLTWQERILYFIPLLLFPLTIIQLRYLFTWYFQHKLDKNSKKLIALRAEKNKILEQVMDRETYKVAENLMRLYGDEPSKPKFSLTSPTPSKASQPLLKHSLTPQKTVTRSNQLALMSTPQTRTNSNGLGSTTSTPFLSTELSTPILTALVSQMTGSGVTQQFRHRTSSSIGNEQDKNVLHRIVLIADRSQDNFALICKECYVNNGMVLKEDFEYTTFRCIGCNVLNSARKARPTALNLSALLPVREDASESSDSADDKDGELPRALPTTQPPLSSINSFATDNPNNDVAEQSSSSISSYDVEVEK